jgi:hypothetical protein
LTQAPGVLAVAPQVVGAVAGHWHSAAAQLPPIGQRMPQPPQFSRLALKLVQSVGVAGGAGHRSGVAPLQVHPPDTQVKVLPQVTPQPPQLASSLQTSMQAVRPPPTGQTSSRGPTQVQEPSPSPSASTQCSRVAQEARQSPQLLASAARLAHWTPSGSRHSVTVRPGVVSQTQAPAVQVPRPQEVPHAPQLNSSLCQSTHCPGPPGPAPQTSA